MPHFEQVEVMAGALTDVVVGVLTMSSRPVIGRRDTYSRVTGVATGVHTRSDIVPYEPSNMSFLLAFE